MDTPRRLSTPPDLVDFEGEAKALFLDSKRILADFREWDLERRLAALRETREALDLLFRISNRENKDS